MAGRNDAGDSEDGGVTGTDEVPGQDDHDELDDDESDDPQDDTESNEGTEDGDGEPAEAVIEPPPGFDLEAELALVEDDIQDDYDGYYDEQLGYAEIDWDKLPQKQVDEHDRIRALTAEGLAELELKRANDLFRWAAARAHLEQGDEAAFETLAVGLLRSKKRSKALDYVDIALALMGRQAQRGNFDAASATLDTLGALANGDASLEARFRAILAIQRGDREEGLEQLAQLAEAQPDDGDLLLSLGEDLCGIGLWEAAVEYLEIAEELSRARGDTDLLASIENAQQFAQRHLGYDDVDD